ncbi:branched-chain amino acid ABC transporter ATP-binding protein/permease [Derxia lacustris]|uniref:branched-chain amino acid ABC transporter ATP-binding protein/permease n=1 Tax=Derxia lacustris TaxID=764842 RepID=UPI000A1710DE|nr:branched-chain amino acid ABC transporter ATP-binding protein/permease [Derxia lacustris]
MTPAQTTADLAAGAPPRARPSLRRAAPALLAAVVLLLPLLPVPEFWITQLDYIGLYSIAVLGVVLLTGVGGLTSFGQAAFVGLGAYTTALLSTQFALSPWLALLASLAVAGGVALLLAAITLRMSGHYLPLATICWGLALFFLMGNVDGLGKFDGIVGIPALGFFGLELRDNRSLFWLIWGLALVAAFAVLRLLDSRAGRAIRALRSGSTMPEAMGIATFRYKTAIFVIAALLAALSGWLFAHFQRTVNPSPFGMHMGIEYLFMAVLGGAGQVWGAFAGAAAVKLLEDRLQAWLPQLLGSAGSYEVIVFGVLLIAMLRFAPKGIWHWVERRWPAPQRRRDWADAAPLPARARPAAAAADGAPLLVARNLRKQFGGLVAVKDVSFSIGHGEIVGLIGPNGAGKSTTFNLLTGVLPASAGEVSFAGRRIERTPSRQIAALGIARSFQHVKMIPEMTVLENVALGAHLRGSAGILRALLGLDRADERRLLREAERQLLRIGMGHLMHEQAGNLALGPQRLMEIARALCLDPALLLLDEPAAGLRHQEKLALVEVLRQLRGEGMSLLLVEHDMDFVMGLTDRIVVMEFGTKLIEGSPEEVRNSPAVRAAYLGTEH